MVLYFILNFENNDPESGNGRMDTPTDLMTSEQRSEYSRLVIEIAATKTEISTIRERIRGNSDAASVRVNLLPKYSDIGFGKYVKIELVVVFT